MWSDNETDVDLLGFDVLVVELAVALTDKRLLPLTLGVLGGWGSGKSSLLKQAYRDLAADGESSPYVCVEFSPWRYEDYEDLGDRPRASMPRCRFAPNIYKSPQRLWRLGVRRQVAAARHWT